MRHARTLAASRQRRAGDRHRVQRCNDNDPAAVLAARVLQLIEDVNDKLLQIARLTAAQ